MTDRQTAEERRKDTWSTYWTPLGTSKQFDEMDDLAREAIAHVRKLAKAIQAVRGYENMLVSDILKIVEDADEWLDGKEDGA